MRLSKITLCGFRCFGSEPTTVRLDEMTALIGENGSGKSAILIALARMFGLSSDLRTIRVDDFHVPRGKEKADFAKEGMKLWIEVQLVFPELSDDDTGAPESTVPQSFRQMSVNEPKADLYCRIRLEANWNQGNLPEGEVDQSLFWITSPGDEYDEVDESDCFAVTSIDRQQIHVHYLPGSRDPARHVRVASRSILKRLMDAAKWDDELDGKVEAAMDQLAENLSDEDAIKELESHLNSAWGTLYNRSRFKRIELQLASQNLQDIVATLSARLLTSPDGESTGVERLSDGLRSILYFSIVKSAFDLEQLAIQNPDSGDDSPPFDADILSPPLLTFFAIEEPETHLAPHLLGRIIRMFRGIVDSDRAQAIFTSHSTSVMSRIEPQEVRHLALGGDSDCTVVSEIQLPPQSDQVADKFIRQAVRAFPELYFARVVVLGEGDSEQVIFNRLLDAFELPADPNVISVVPLGGRHVNHMWRLLGNLSIPHVTLLDLDRERVGGGWGRVHYVCTQLLENGVDRDELLETFDGGDVLSDEEFEALGKGETDEDLSSWINFLEDYGVFFSAPLDVDFMMYRAFREDYKATSESKPRALSAIAKKKAEQLLAINKAVLRDDPKAGETFTEPERKSFRWYRHFFLTRSKPATHIAALNRITNRKLKADCPAVLKRVINAVKVKLEPAQDGDE